VKSSTAVRAVKVSKSTARTAMLLLYGADCRDIIQNYQIDLVINSPRFFKLLVQLHFLKTSNNFKYRYRKLIGQTF
jgi:hypothetical protein